MKASSFYFSMASYSPQTSLGPEITRHSVFSGLPARSRQTGYEWPLPPIIGFQLLGSFDKMVAPWSLQLVFLSVLEFYIWLQAFSHAVAGFLPSLISDFELGQKASFSFVCPNLWLSASPRPESAAPSHFEVNPNWHSVSERFLVVYYKSFPDFWVLASSSGCHYLKGFCRARATFRLAYYQLWEPEIIFWSSYSNLRQYSSSFGFITWIIFWRYGPCLGC